MPNKVKLLNDFIKDGFKVLSGERAVFGYSYLNEAYLLLDDTKTEYIWVPESFCLKVE